MSDWEEWLVEWHQWMGAVGEVEEVNGVDGVRPDVASDWRLHRGKDWGDRVPEFMDGEL